MPSFPPDERFHGSDKGQRVKPILSHEVGPRSAVGEGVAYAHSAQAYADAVFRHQFGDFGAEASDDRMIFHRNNAITRSRESVDQGLAADGLVGGYMQMADRQAGLNERGGGAHRFLRADSGCHERYVRARRQRAHATRDKWLVGREKPRNLTSQHPDVNGSWRFDHGIEQGLHFGGIARLEDRHVRHRPHDGNIFDSLVRRPARRRDAGRKPKNFTGRLG